MILKLFLLFTIVPLIELYVLIEIGKRLGSLTTIGIILLTAIIGAWLAKDIIMFPYVWRAHDINRPGISRSMIGECGIVKKRLDPSGYIQIGGELWRAESLEEVLREADVVSLHTVLDETTYHMINAERLALMKENAILINTSRGPVIDESALVAHCRKHPNFRAGLDVFEEEPKMKPGLSDLDNVVIVPHIASASVWTREGMATLAASNVAGILMGYPAWQDQDISPFLKDDSPRAARSIVNAKEVGIPAYSDAREKMTGALDSQSIPVMD